MTALRHSNIGTTSSYYTDNKRIIAMPVSNVFKVGDAELPPN